VEQTFDRVREFFSSLDPRWIVAGVVVVLVVLFLPRLLDAARALLRRAHEDLDAGLEVDLAAFSDRGPDPSDPLQFFCRQFPARIALVIVAPLGRDQPPPDVTRLSDSAEYVVPGLGRVIARDRPEVRAWPAQLSAQGFIHKVFRRVHLPGMRGRGTPWCLVAGRAQGPERTFLLALALCTSDANTLGEIAVESEEKWLDVLRVRDEE
jgi:hypothetical protein